MTIASREAARAWRRNELDKLRHAVARASAELRRLDGEVEKLAGALGDTGAAPAMAVLDSLRERRAETAAEIDRLMKAASEAFTDMCIEEAAATPATAPVPETLPAAAAAG